MSTRSNIGYKDTNTGKIHFVYCYFDGYIDGVGYDLLKEYPTMEDAQKLVDAGDMSCPGEPYTMRGEDFEDLKPRIVETPNEIVQQEYSYVFMDGNWHYSEGGEFKKFSINDC